jgi:YfiH family protein
VAVLTASLLERLDGIEHGFGTRHANLPQASMASVHQIHSNLTLIAGGPGCAGEADALLTNQPGLAVSVRTADCLPILLADPYTRSVAAIHAGWRGTAAGIVDEAIARMRSEYGTQAAHIRAAIGPGIGACCYEVGIEVAQRFGYARAGKIDLAAENRRQLLDAGVPAGQIEVMGQCTSCNLAQFFSWRREGEKAGRMVSYIRIPME